MKYYGGRWGFFPGLSPMVKYLILANSAVFLFQLVFGPKLTALLGLTPALFWKGALWQPFTYMFLHGGIFHLLFNMFVLYMFGTTLESTWGARRFIKFYFICGAGAGLVNAIVMAGDVIPTVGASGAIYGLLMAFGILFPNQLIYIWGVFPVKAKFFVIGIGVIEFLTALSTTRSGIAHVAHLGGMLFGLVYMKWDDWQRSVSGWRDVKRQKRHLKVVWDRELEKRKLQEEIDALLDKAAKSGTGSLTKEEHERFRRASEKMAEMESKE